MDAGIIFLYRDLTHSSVLNGVWFIGYSILGYCMLFLPTTNISIQILHTLLHTFPFVLTRRICLTIKDILDWQSFL